MSIHCYDRNTDRNRHSARYWLSVGYRIKIGGSSSTFRTSIIAVVLSWRCWHIVMRLAIHVPGRFHARTEPWRYEDFPRPAACREGCKGFLEYGPTPSLPVREGEQTPPQPSHRGGSSYNRLVPHQQNIILPSIQGGAGGRVRFILQKPLHPSLHAAGRGNPRIVKGRSSHGISHEHKRAGAWQYVSTTKTKRWWWLMSPMYCFCTVFTSITHW